MGIYSANYATLQGTRNLKLMAQANVFGAISGFLCSLPMFYFFFRDEGIVWALILTALSTTAVSLFYVKKAYIPKVDQTFAESYRIGLKAVRLGIMLALSGISVTLVQFAIKTFIVRMGGLNDVGLYEAGWALNTTYLGLVFTAMAKDYYPRLSQIAGDNAQVKSDDESTDRNRIGPFSTIDHHHDCFHVIFHTVIILRRIPCHRTNDQMAAYRRFSPGRSLGNQFRIPGQG